MELADLHGEGGVDPGGSFGEYLEELTRHPDDLGLAVHDRLPRQPIAVGELGPQHRLVEAAQHPLMTLQVAGVQREPTAVVRVHLGRDHGVRVDLRIVGPRRRLTKRRHRQPVRVRMQPTSINADPGGRPEPFQMLQRRRHGDVVSLEERAVSGECPPHTQRLRGRERRIEPRHRPQHPAARGRPIAQHVPQRRPRYGVTAPKQGFQLRGFDLTNQSEPSPAHQTTPPSHPARPPSSGCSTRRSPPLTTRTELSPATSHGRPTGTCL
jgi:hypothetical protein